MQILYLLSNFLFDEQYLPWYKKGQTFLQWKTKGKRNQYIFSIVIIFLNLDNEEQKVLEKPETFSETFSLW